jgi:hypothetical protein
LFHGSSYRVLFAHKADRKPRDPTAAANDANPFNESYWTPIPQFEGEDEGDIRGGDQQTCGNRIPDPAAPGRIGGIAPCQHEASRNQRVELKLAKEIMKGSVNGGRARHSRWVTQHRVGHEDPGYDESEAIDAEQDGSPGGTTSCAQEQPEPDGKTEQEHSADDVVGDLYPPTLPQFEVAVGDLPGVVARTCGPKDENDKMLSSGPMAPQARSSLVETFCSPVFCAEVSMCFSPLQ